MKKFLISALMLFAAGGSFASKSQYFMDGQPVEHRSCALPVMFTDGKEFSESILYWSALESRVVSGTLISDAKSVKVRALNDFQIRFNDASQVQWYSDLNGYTTYFKKDGYNDRAFYSKSGRWMYSVIFKRENQLPKDIRAAIKSVYYDWNMTMIEEVQSVEGKGYIVYLEDQSTIRILKVNADSEIETMMDLVKQ
jgi:hypothetical protein